MNPLFLNPWAIAGAGAIAVGLFLGGSYTGYEVRDGIAAKADRAALVAAHSETLREVKIATDAGKLGQQITYDYGMMFARAQIRNAKRTDDLLRKVAHYVPPSADVAAPINLGFVRYFDANAVGAHDPSTLPIASGQPDGAASDVKLSEVATVSAANDGAFRENADRIVVLQGYVVAVHKWAEDVFAKLNKEKMP